MAVPTRFFATKPSSVCLELRGCPCGSPRRFRCRLRKHRPDAVACSERSASRSRPVAVDHGGVDQAGIHHLQDVFVFEIFVGEHDFHRRLASGLEPRVERLETGVVAARTAHVDAAPGELFDGRRRGASAEVTRISLTSSASGAVKSTSLRRSGVIVRPAAAMSPRPSASAGSSWSRLVGMNTTRIGRARSLLPRVELFLELHAHVVGDAALLRLVDEIEGLAVDHEHAHHASFRQGREIAGPGRQSRRHRGLWRGGGAWRPRAAVGPPAALLVGAESQAASANGAEQRATAQSLSLPCASLTTARCARNGTLNLPRAHARRMRRHSGCNAHTADRRMDTALRAPGTVAQFPSNT